MWMHLRQALAFLTRFPLACHSSDPICSVPYFLPAGFFLGLFLSLSAVAVNCLLITLPYHAFLAGFFWLCLEIWSTRALHWDGLADLADALGSGAQGQRFLDILRDSRLGSFGAITLFLVLLGHFLLVSLQLLQEHYVLLALAPAFARAMPVLLAKGLAASSGSSLGLVVLQALTKYPQLFRLNLAFVLLLPLVLCLWQESIRVLWLYPLLYVLVRFLRSTAQAKGGISGDYYGAAIELSQLAFLFCTL
ncbi:MAG: adenosylcobinamide-GDP ribazoletransferase [Desulfovibrio sp.]|nr:adenosylcobinamide-GDP ribazoletransferase [Desulfovibrio sp.]